MKINEKNIGTVGQVKNALRVANGKYFKPIATDDLLDIDSLQRELLNYECNYWDIFLSRCAILENKPTNSFVGKSRYMRLFYDLPRWFKLLCLSAGNNLIAVGAVYKTERYKEIMKHVRTRE